VMMLHSIDELREPVTHRSKGLTRHGHNCATRFLVAEASLPDGGDSLTQGCTQQATPQGELPSPGKPVEAVPPDAPQAGRRRLSPARRRR
jgi:hypothetical protein